MPPSWPVPWGGGHHGADLPSVTSAGARLVIDGYSGDLFIEPNQVILTEYRQLLRSGHRHPGAQRRQPASGDADGTKVSAAQRG